MMEGRDDGMGGWNEGWGDGGLVEWKGVRWKVGGIEGW